MDALRGSLQLQEVPTAQALKRNPAMTQSAKPHKHRQEFFENLRTMPFDELVARYSKKPFSLRNTMAAMMKNMGLGPVIHKVKILGNRGRHQG